MLPIARAGPTSVGCDFDEVAQRLHINRWCHLLMRLSGGLAWICHQRRWGSRPDENSGTFNSGQWLKVRKTGL